MKIEKLPSGSYRVRKMIKGKTVSLTFDTRPTKADIEEELNKRLGYYNGRMTFEQAAISYINTRSNTCSPSTLKGYHAVMRSISPRFLAYPIDDITGPLVQAEVNRRASEVSAKTVRNFHGFVASVLAEYRPDLQLRTRLPMMIKKEPYVPNNDDVMALLAYAKDTPYEVPILLAMCSMRRGEICALTDDDVDLENGIVHVTKDMVQDADNNWVIKPPKTPTSVRDIPIKPFIVDAIKRNGLYKGCPDSIFKWMQKAEKRLGIPQFSIHKLRHWFVSNAHENGTSDADIMYVGGWSNPNVMIQRYRHSRKNSKDVMDSVFKDIF